MSGGCRGSDGHVVELILKFKNHTLGSLLSNTLDPGEGGVVGGADGRDQPVSVDAAEHGDSELRADAGDGEQLLKEAFSCGSAKPKRAIWSSRTCV